MHFCCRALLAVLLTGVLALPSYAYDDVQVGTISPWVIKKARVEVLRSGPQKELWGLDRSQNAIQQWSTDGTLKRSITPNKSAHSLIKKPVDFALSPQGIMAVSDAGLKRLAFIDIADKTPVLISAWPVEQAGAVAISADGVVAHAHQKNKEVQIFSPHGVLLHSLVPSQPHELKSMTALVYGVNGVLWVLDGEQGKLHRFSPERRWLGVTELLGKTTAVDVDDYGFAYVLGQNGRWMEVDSQGKLSGTFGTRGKLPGQMSGPLGIVAQNDGVLWVSDTGNNRFQQFKVKNENKKEVLLPSPAARLDVSLDRRFPMQVKSIYAHHDGRALVVNSKKSVQWIGADGAIVSTWPKKSADKNRVRDMAAVASSFDGALWVADAGTHQLKQVTPEGDVKKVVGQKGKKEGQLIDPGPFFVRPDGSFVVADQKGSRAQVLSKDGLFLFALGGGKNAIKFENIVGIGGHRQGFALLDQGRKALLFFDAQGKLITEVSNKEGQAPLWREPGVMAVDPLRGDVFVMDKGASRIRVFDSLGKFLGDIAVVGDRMAYGPEGTLWLASAKEMRVGQVQVAPRSIDNVSAVDEAGFLRLQWNADAYAASYRIYRASGDEAFEQVASTPSVSFLDMKVIPGVEYRYAVAGETKEGWMGNWSTVVTIKAPMRADVPLISISNVALEPVFTAAYKFYVDNPIGSIDITNNSNRATRNIKASVLLKDYTDFPTEKTLDVIMPGQTISLPIALTLNTRVLEINENTPVQADIRLTYFESNNEKTVTHNAPLMLYSRYAISWKDKKRLASFVTPKDPPIVEFSRAAIKEFLAPLKGATVGKPLAKAALLFEALRAHNIAYVPDPKTPFHEVSAQLDVLDYVQFPRETLRRKTGDCDDTTALYASLLMSMGVDVAFVDMPGHILLMVDTEESDRWALGLPEERYVLTHGRYWAPIETTALSQGFVKAWQAGISKIKSVKNEKEVQFVPVLDAHLVYPPVSIMEKEALSEFPLAAVKKEFPAVLDALQKERYQFQLSRIQQLIKSNPADDMLKIQLGMVHYEGQKTDEAKKVFETLIKNLDAAVSASAHNNLGNMAFLADDLKTAQAHYDAAAKLLPQDGGILINQARCAWKLKDADRAKALLKEAKPLVAGWTDFVSDLPAELWPQ